MYRIFALLFGLILFSSKGYALEQDVCAAKQCMIVVDAGSSGSRLHFYTYDLDNTNSPIHIEEIWSKKTKPGISHVEVNRPSIDAYLVTLFSGTPNTQRVPVYIYATAGMRLLPAAKQKLIYQEINRWFAQQHQWSLVEAKTIFGRQEAIFDWLAVNHHLNTLTSIQSQSVGVMDMGGASVQIVFPIQNQQSLASSSVAEFDLYGQHVTLLVKSFLGLGQNEMSHQFLNDTNCYSNNYPLPDGLVGEGNANFCADDISLLMNGVHGVNREIQTLLANNPVSTWYALGSLSFLADNSVIHFDNNQVSNQELLDHINANFCQKPWEDIDLAYPNEEYLYQFCLYASYFYALMVHGYGIAPNEPIHYLPANQNLDWTVGVVLYPHSSAKE